MAEPGRSLRDLAERLLNGGVKRDEARALFDDLVARRPDLAGLIRELGLVTRAEHEELELRIAQLEHRLRLLEAERSPE
ncbi:MAG: hypothetical protein M3R70_07510 [Actinomycetota bacterium]|nr:hypothetical protein [Actinomycetota bacterium]